jgi:hypothetical protein
VDLSTLLLGSEEPTAEMIRNHVRMAVAKDDPVMGAKLEACLQGDADRARWIFLLDSLDEMAIAWPPELIELRMEQFFEAVHRFLRPGGGRFRAVVTTREPPEPGGYPILAVEPLSRRQQHKLMRITGAWSPMQRRLLREFRRVAPDAFKAPLTLLWCKELVQFYGETGQVAVPATMNEMVEATVNARLQTVPGDDRRAEDTRAIAERIAFYMATEVELSSAPTRTALVAALARDEVCGAAAAEEAMHLLAAVRLAITSRPHSFAFAHRSFQDFFTASWLMGGHDQPELEVILTDHRWREAAIAVLQVGPSDLRERLMGVAATIVQDEISRFPGIVSDIGTYVAVDARAPLPVLTPVAGPRITNSGRLLHVLSLVATGLSNQPTLVPETISVAAGQVVVTEFLRGNRWDQKTALELLPLLSSHLARWACERAINSGSWLLLQAAVKAFQESDFIESMPIQSRLGLITTVLRRPQLVDHVISASNSSRSKDTLLARVHALMLVMRIGAAVIAGICTFLAITHWAWFPVILTIVPLIFLSLSFLYDRPAVERLQYWTASFFVGDRSAIEAVQYWSASIVVFTSGILAVVGLTSLPISIFNLSRQFGTGVYDLAVVYVQTWPVSMMGNVITNPTLTRRDWYCPQWWLAGFLFNELLVRTTNLSPWSVLRRAVVTIGAVGIAITIVAILYRMQSLFEGRSWIIYSIAGVILVVALVRKAVSTRAKSMRIRRSIMNGTMTDQGLLAWLTAAGRVRDVQRLLIELRQARPGALHDCATTLTDLAQTLEHVDRMVPDGAEDRIPRGVWDVGPEFSQPDFRHWLEEYDESHRGQLRWLASTHRDTVADLLERAMTMPASTLQTAARGRTADEKLVPEPHSQVSRPDVAQ